MTINNNIDHLRTARLLLEASAESAQALTDALHRALNYIETVEEDLDAQRALIVDHVLNDIIGQPDDLDIWEHHERLLGEELVYVVEES